jgi:hypothetical protein
MSARIECEVEYAEQLSYSLQAAFPGALDNNVLNAVETGVNRILEDARHFVPIRTGYLLSTIGAETLAKWSFTIYARASYAGYVEWGTRRMHARLYMTRAIEMHKDELSQELADAVIKSAQECGISLG